MSGDYRTCTSRIITSISLARFCINRPGQLRLSQAASARLRVQPPQRSISGEAFRSGATIVRDLVARVATT